ncbi:hypothetical protein J3R82DRAFT_10484 [Butyriboletus roseoflavus]|nr:hypothetical protein J3R82DRAFT_10484 [Butyriboletus roseoflavus]
MEQVAIDSRSDASLAPCLFLLPPLTNSAALAGTADKNASPFAEPVDDTFLTTTPAGVPVAPLTAAAPTELEQPSQPAPPKPPLYRRRWFIIFVIGNCLGIVLLFIMLFPVVKAIIQDIVNGTTLDITSAAITSPTNTSWVCLFAYVSLLTPSYRSFQLSIQGTVAHTSSIPAVISFPTPVNVSWIDGSTKVPLGYVQLSTLYASNNHATINDTTTFYITDQNAFGRFTSAMITSQNFTWQLENYGLSIQAVKFPTAHGISFNKMVTINGESHVWSLHPSLIASLQAPTILPEMFSWRIYSCSVNVDRCSVRSRTRECMCDV